MLDGKISYREPLNMNLIVTQIIKAYKDAVDVPVNDEKELKQKHEMRSRKFIDLIHAKLMPSDKNQFVLFSKRISNAVLPLQEFLYDIHVCEYGSFDSLKNKKIGFIKKSVVQLECEFDDDIRNSSLDFSKLVCGNAKMKIMILPLSGARSRQTVTYYCNKFEDLASRIAEPLFLIFLPHPKYWEEASIKSVYQIRRFNIDNCKWDDETNKFW